MGTVEDVRKAIQDLVAPDLQALKAEIKSVDEMSKLRDEALSAKIDSKFELIMAKMEANHATVMNALNIDRRLEALEQKAPVSMQAS